MLRMHHNNKNPLTVRWDMGKSEEMVQFVEFSMFILLSFQLEAIWNEMLWSSSNFSCLVSPITVKSGLKYEKEKS